MKKIINYIKKLPKSTICIFFGVIIFLAIGIWMIIMTNKINKLTEIKETNNVEMVEEEKTMEEKIDETEEKENIEESKEETKQETGKSIEKSNTNKSSNTKSSSNNTQNNSTFSNTQNYNQATLSADDEVIAYFNETKINLDNSSLREKAKENFITIVDFLFYGGTIKGHTFNELTTKAKLQVLKIALSIDQKIDKYFPDYKEKISATTTRVYTNTKELIVSKYLDITTSICEKDPDTCCQAKSDFQDMKKSFSLTWDVIKSLANKGTANLKAWYEIYSGK